MNKKFRIMADITCDLSKEWYEENDATTILHGIVVDGNEYWDEFGSQISKKEVMEKIRGGANVTTLQCKLEDFEAFFTSCAQDGVGGIYVGFSSALSGTYSVSCMAIKHVKEQYPNAEIYSIDSLAASLGQGLLVREALRLRDLGTDTADAAKALEDSKLKTCHFFTVDDLNHLYKGGRLSKSSALLGTLMGVKPVMYVSDEGKLTPIGKVRGRKASMKELAKYTKDSIVQAEKQTIFIVHADAAEDAAELASYVKEHLPKTKIVIEELSPVIAVHSGPGTLAIFFWGDKRL